MRRITPQTFQRVELSLFVKKNMHQNIRIIHHQPLAGYRTFRGQRRNMRMLSDSFPDAAIDGLEMRFRRTGADHKEVGERRNPAQVENDDVLGLLIFG